MKHKRSILFGIFICLFSLTPTSAQVKQVLNLSGESPRILVYTHTNGYRHSSIETGVATLRDIALEAGISMDQTEDSLQFNPRTLSAYQLVVFLNTTGDILGPQQEKAFEAYIRQGGNFMGVHAATDTEYDWPWYGQLVGAYFKSHPRPQRARLEVTDPNHPATAHLPGVWMHTDEWYNFRNMRQGITVLLNLDEGSYNGGKNGAIHPIAWCHTLSGGRAFYTGLGHAEATYANEAFKEHLAGGIRYCLGLE